MGHIFKNAVNLFFYDHLIHLLYKIHLAPALLLGMVEEKEKEIGQWFQLKMHTNHLKIKDEGLGIPS